MIKSTDIDTKISFTVNYEVNENCWYSYR